MASIEGLANLALSVVLVIRYGAIGAVVATMATSAVIVLLRLPLACRETACPGRRLTAQAIAPAVASTLPSVLVMLASLAAVESPVARVVLGLGGGWSVAAVIALRQIGPRRLRTMVAFRESPALR
jgi:O-antigen/teichoic acid export membrane protein